MKVLGLTGGIGSGKSTVAAIFRVLGAPVYNSDDRARELYFEAGVRKEIESLLGKKAYPSQGGLDKEYIRKKIFADADLLAKVNAVIHPAVRADFEEFKKRHKPAAYLVKESALLFEVGITRAVDKIALVIATAEIRKQRLLKRDPALSGEAIEKIISRQMSDSEKIARVDWIIENNEEKLLIPQVLKIHQELLH
jgi:dephospho-CoA kinase